MRLTLWILLLGAAAGVGWAGGPGDLVCGDGSQASSLWGCNGELYDPSGRLLDYSYAGYMHGEAELPDSETLPVTHNVKDYGACGDGSTDDSEAFLRALADLPDASESNSCVLHIPRGTYVLTQQLNISRQVVLRGDGSDCTTLVLPYNLSYVNNNYKPNAYSWDQAFLYFKPQKWITDDSNIIGTVPTGTAKRGDTTVQVTLSPGVDAPKPGQWVILSLWTPTTPDWYLEMNLNTVPGCNATGGFCKYPKMAFNHPTRVVSFDGEELCVERPLPWDLFSNMPVYLYKWSPMITQAGVEGLTLQFPSDSVYPGHLKESGYNGIQFEQVAHSWIRDVQVINADTAITVFRSMFVTVTDVTLSATGTRAQATQDKGHHGFQTSGQVDCLWTDFDITTTFHHDITVDKFGSRSVFTSGQGVNMNLDMHRAQNYGTLFVDIDLGKGTRPFQSGGDSEGRGLHAGSFTTYWNIYASDNDGSAPGCPKDFGSGLNFVGWYDLDKFPALDSNNITATWLVETMAPEEVCPQNIYLAQRAKRLGLPQEQPQQAEPSTAPPPEEPSPSPPQEEQYPPQQDEQDYPPQQDQQDYPPQEEDQYPQYQYPQDNYPKHHRGGPWKWQQGGQDGYDGSNTQYDTTTYYVEGDGQSRGHGRWRRGRRLLSA